MVHTRIAVSRYGQARFGDLQCPAVVLETGQHGYVFPDMATALGLDETHWDNLFLLLLADVSPSSLSPFDDETETILLPSGREAQFCPAGWVSETIVNIVVAVVQGRLRSASSRLLTNCLKVLTTLAVKSELELIDEATRAPAPGDEVALLDRIAGLLRQACPSWQGCFDPSYHHALYRVLGWTYDGRSKRHPAEIEWITLQWVYGPVLPETLLRELRRGAEVAPEHRQWLADRGIEALDLQIDAVTAIARLAKSYRDLLQRCEGAFGKAPADADDIDRTYREVA